MPSADGWIGVHVPLAFVIVGLAVWLSVRGAQVRARASRRQRAPRRYSHPDMTRRLTLLFSAFEALLVVAIGVAIPLVPLTILWAAQFGFAPDWSIFWRGAADIWLIGHGVDVDLHARSGDRHRARDRRRGRSGQDHHRVARLRVC